jgi:anaerobic ribonucleoside-triphosphate reductase
MKNIIYFDARDKKSFDFERYAKSLKNLADVPEEAIKEALKKVDQYENMHVSVLVELGTALLAKYGNEDIAKKYFESHDQYFGGKFERLRRITGYLVGTLDRWNDGKKAEERVRVKHSVNSSIDDNERASRLAEQAIARNVAYAA